MIFGYYLPTFSQLDSRPQIDTTFSDQLLKNSIKPLGLVDSIGLNRLCNDSNNKKLIYLKLSEIDLRQDKDTIRIMNKLQTFDNMPCIKPEGFFPMPIDRPDSTVKYTLLIKKH